MQRAGSLWAPIDDAGWQRHLAVCESCGAQYQPIQVFRLSGYHDRLYRERRCVITNWEEIITTPATNDSASEYQVRQRIFSEISYGDCDDYLYKVRYILFWLRPSDTTLAALLYSVFCSTSSAYILDVRQRLADPRLANYYIDCIDAAIGAAGGMPVAMSGFTWMLFDEQCSLWALCLSGDVRLLCPIDLVLWWLVYRFWAALQTCLLRLRVDAFATRAVLFYLQVPLSYISVLPADIFYLIVHFIDGDRARRSERVLRPPAHWDARLAAVALCRVESASGYSVQYKPIR